MSRDHSSDEQPTLTKSKLIADIRRSQSTLSKQDIELAVSCVLKRMSKAIVTGERIEIRGFGSVNLHYRPSRTGRNPKTAEQVQVQEKYAPHFKPGASLRKRVNNRRR